MKKILVVDVGGTTIKYGIWDEENKILSEKGSVETPRDLESFYQALQQIRDRFDGIEGIGMSIPGAVDQSTGVIGGISAIPYIHNFPIQKEFENKLNLPVSMENDANCAALAEVSMGAAKNLDNVLFVVIGTGVGGAVVIDRKIIHGSQLYGGEFGMMLGPDNKQLSTVGTAVHVAQNYNNKYHAELTGREVLDLAFSGSKEAMDEVEIMYNSLAHVIYNLQFSTDPQKIIIGGGVSANSEFIQGLNEKLRQLVEELDGIPIIPQVVAAEMKNDANLIGAAYNFYH